MQLLSRGQCGERLRRIFPVDVVGERGVAGPLASAAIYVCVYVGAYEAHNPIRPSMVVWMCDEVAARAERPIPEQFEQDRERWYRAALIGRRQVTELLAEWRISHTPWYADNTREPLRDEIFRAWRRLGAMQRDEAVPTTSSRPAWSLRGDFAALFSPALTGRDLDEGIAIWQAATLGTVERARIRLARERTAAQHAVSVRLPGGAVRSLRPGDSSLILKGIIETLAPRLLEQPAILAVSESARKVDVLDEELLQELGLSLEAGRLLPDALLFDVDPGRLWFVEAVASDGEIHSERKEELLEWAGRQGIARNACGFISGFLSRTHEAFRRAAASLAWGTLVWFLDEPDQVIRLEDLPPKGCGEQHGTRS